MITLNRAKTVYVYQVVWIESRWHCGNKNYGQMSTQCTQKTEVMAGI